MKLALRNSDHSLREAFYLLKKYSSYSWQSEIVRQNKLFVDGYEREFLRHPPPNYQPTAWDEENIRIFWSYQAELDDGLAELMKGNRTQAYQLLRHGSQNEWLWSRRFEEMDLSEFGKKFIGKVNTGIFAHAQRATLMSLFRGNSRHIDDLRRDTYALPDWITDRDDAIAIMLGIPFGITGNDLQPFPEVPSDAVSIESDEEVPYSGIWAVEQSTDRKDETYCLAYLHVGVPAVRMVSEREYELNTRFNRMRDALARLYSNKIMPYPVRWRLIWRDTRYEDGTIPPEEAEYLAVNPATDPTQRLRCKAGWPCPLDGYWSTPARANSRRHFQSGELMPEFTSDYGETIWTFDADQKSRA